MIIAAGYAIGFGFTLTVVARTCWRMRRRPARAVAGRDTAAPPLGMTRPR